MSTPLTHAGGRLEAAQREILARGMAELLELTRSQAAFTPFPSERYPLPLRHAVYGGEVSPQRARADVEANAAGDPVRALEACLVLAELAECGRPDAAELFPDDLAFVRQVFQSKRANGWCHLVGGDEASRRAARAAVEERWQFKFFPAPDPYRATGLYVLLERLARYAFVYGRCRPGDPHEIGHFIEDHTPGVLVCLAPLSELELTLSLAAMKLGLPAVVPADYPFSLGRQSRAGRPEEIAAAVAGFANIRRLLPHPGRPDYPDWCLDRRPEVKEGEEPEPPAAVFGETPDSFFLLRKTTEAVDGVRLVGDPGAGDPALGVLVEVRAEPLDAVDRRYIEGFIFRQLWRVPGHRFRLEEGRLRVGVAPGFAYAPERIAAALHAACRREFPRIAGARVTAFVESEPIRRGEWPRQALEERVGRQQEINSLTEENCPTFFSCVGCSPFAPDHVCVVTPERVPQCNRSYGEIKTGALYQYDDMSNIHHSRLHREINSFLVLEKGDCLDPVAGEWSGPNRRAREMTHGRTTRIQLHALGEAPTTGCGCFQFIIFRLEKPRPGLGIMHRLWPGAAPDGRRWVDLHYALAGKQAPGLSGCAAGYFRSPKFMQAEGGWPSVVWVTGKVAQLAGKYLPPAVGVAD